MHISTLMAKRFFLTLTSCMIISCSSPEAKFYVLNPARFMPKFKRHRLITIGLDPINIAPYLQKPQLALRLSSNELSYDEFNRWAEQMDQNIARVIQSNLSALIKSSVVNTSPWPIGFTPKYRLQINIIRFEGNHNGYSVFDARYKLVNINGDKIYLLDAVHYKRPLSSLTAKAVVASMNSNLNQFSHHLAKKIPH